MFTLASLRAWYRNLRPIGSTDEAGLLFMVCNDCRAVVPKWRLIRAKAKLDEIGCPKCGCIYCKPRRISEVRAALWVLIRGYLWRRYILRREDWEPRVPWRHIPADPS